MPAKLNINVLVTAGPTWVPLDKVRVITSIFTGNTGYLIAKNMARQGFKVDLLINPRGFTVRGVSNLKIETFLYFRELKALLQRKLTGKTYQLIIHSAAVSDYRAVDVYPGKIPSRSDSLRIDLRPTPKLVRLIKKLAPYSKLVQFKLEAGGKKKELVSKAYCSLKKNKSDFVVANDLFDLQDNRYKALVVDGKCKVTPIHSRKELVRFISGIGYNILSQ